MDHFDKLCVVNHSEGRVSSINHSCYLLFIGSFSDFVVLMRYESNLVATVLPLLTFATAFLYEHKELAFSTLD